MDRNWPSRRLGEPSGRLSVPGVRLGSESQAARKLRELGGAAPDPHQRLSQERLPAGWVTELAGPSAACGRSPSRRGRTHAAGTPEPLLATDTQWVNIRLE